VTIEVIKPGLLSTLQDSGRHGFQHLGVLANGAMDIVAHRLANLLAQNEDDAATLELTLQGPHLKFHTDALIAITGAEMHATVDECRLPLWRPVWVRKGAELRFRFATRGCRAYLAVHGGFAAPLFLGSRSTYLRGALGGHHGRALVRGDILAIASNGTRVRAWRQATHGDDKSAQWADWGVSPHQLALLGEPGVIRVVAAGHMERFSTRARSVLLTQPFKLSAHADRMGYRLEGAMVDPPPRFEALSQAVAYGSVQVPPDGKPIVLMADRQPTGGYPCIAVVATVDLPQLAQMRPGDTFRFALIDLNEAQQLVLARERLLVRMANSFVARAEASAGHGEVRQLSCSIDR
jgi:antagonist of KipI